MVLEALSSCARAARASLEPMSVDFYCRYYVGHKGKFGHEFMEFEVQGDGKLRYANNSNYKNDVMIRKEVVVSPGVVEELKRIIEDSEIVREDDRQWPEADHVGRQELEIKIGDEHISFTCTKIGSTPSNPCPDTTAPIISRSDLLFFGESVFFLVCV